MSNSRSYLQISSLQTTKFTISENKILSFADRSMKITDIDVLMSLVETNGKKKMFMGKEIYGFKLKVPSCVDALIWFKYEGGVNKYHHIYSLSLSLEDDNNFTLYRNWLDIEMNNIIITHHTSYGDYSYELWTGSRELIIPSNTSISREQDIDYSLAAIFRFYKNLFHKINLETNPGPQIFPLFLGLIKKYPGFKNLYFNKGNFQFNFSQDFQIQLSLSNTYGSQNIDTSIILNYLQSVPRVSSFCTPNSNNFVALAGVLTKLTDHKNVTDVSLHCCEKLSEEKIDTIFPLIAKNPNLVTLSLSGLYCLGEKFRIFEGNRNIELLSMPGSKINMSNDLQKMHYASLTVFKGIKCLAPPFGCKSKTDVQFLAQFPNLLALDLSENDLDCEATKFVLGLPSLRALSLKNDNIYYKIDFPDFTNSEIECFEYSSSSYIAPQELSKISQSKIKRLRLNIEIKIDHLKVLLASNTLLFLDIESIYPSDELLQSLVNLLTKNHRLLSMEIAWTSYDCQTNSELKQHPCYTKLQSLIARNREEYRDMIIESMGSGATEKIIPKEIAALIFGYLIDTAYGFSDDFVYRMHRLMCSTFSRTLSPNNSAYVQEALTSSSSSTSSSLSSSSSSSSSSFSSRATLFQLPSPSSSSSSSGINDTTITFHPL